MTPPLTHEEYLWARVFAAIEAAYPAPRRPGAVLASEIVAAHEGRPAPGPERT